MDDLVAAAAPVKEGEKPEKREKRLAALERRWIAQDEEDRAVVGAEEPGALGAVPEAAGASEDRERDDMLCKCEQGTSAAAQCRRRSVAHRAVFPHPDFVHCARW